MSQAVSRARAGRRSIRRLTAGKVIICVLMALLCLIILVPMLNMVAKSFCDPAWVSKMSGYQIWPTVPSVIHYRVVLSSDAMWVSLKNSLIITLGGTALSVVLTCAAAYAMTRPGLPGKKLLMGFFLAMMVLSAPILQWYFVMRGYNLINNRLSMILYGCVDVYNMILLMRFFEDTPPAILEAARIDGAGDWTLLFRIFIPLNKVPIITVMLFYIVPKWNEYFASGVFLAKDEVRVLQCYLRSFIVDNNSEAINSDIYMLFRDTNLTALQYATIVVSTIPLLCLYPTILKYFTSGVLAGGVKE
ncbi:MAG: carbohydrate ABC transporter permease [Clostridia bacterium]|nr:carbohydrate ABC transporter permease [Clostridia bacterium]